MQLYEYPQTSIQEIINYAENGKIQIPNFQREWVWGKNNVRDLLVSILKEQSIGVLTRFRVPNGYSEFEYFPPVNVRSDVACNEEKYLVLDGQQRVTAIYQTLCSRSDDERQRDAYQNPISEATYVKRSKGRNSGVDKAYFYVDIDKFMNGDFGDDVIVITDNRKIVKERGNLDLATTEAEIDNKLFPLWLVFDTSARKTAWKDVARKKMSAEEYGKCDRFIDELLGRLSNYKIPTITLMPENNLASVCRVFEKVNNTGVGLSHFDLLNARFAADGYKLRDKWKKVKADFKDKDVDNILDTTKSVKEDNFLMTIALISTYRRGGGTNASCRKDDVLNLTSVDFEDCYGDVTEGYIEAAKFLMGHCGVHSCGMIPSFAQLTTMAAIFATLTNDEINSEINLKRISLWYWRALFGEQYASSSDSQAAKDFVQVVAWIRGDIEPDSVSRYEFNASMLPRLENNKTLGKGIFTLLIQNGVRDFYSGEQISKVAFRRGDFEIHHIFPKKYCDTQGIEKDRYDTVINMTPIKHTTNQDIKDKAPSVYVGEMDGRRTEEATREEDTNGILKDHLIDPDSIRRNDFNTFYTNRLAALTHMINDATGRDAVDDALSDDYVEEDDGEDDEDDTE